MNSDYHAEDTVIILDINPHALYSPKNSCSYYSLAPQTAIVCLCLNQNAFCESFPTVNYSPCSLKKVAMAAYNWVISSRLEQ